jgi:hypothetical protein
MLSTRQRTKYFGGTLAAVCELMRSSGIPEAVARQEIQAALERSYKRKASRAARQAPAISRCADVCTRWHLEKAFVDRSGMPRALTWDGKKGTLERLATLVVGRESSREIIKELMSRKLLRKLPGEGWVPKSKLVAPSGLDHSQIMRASTMIGRLLRTIAHNTALKYRGDVLFEITAQVPRLPTRDLPAFKRFTKVQGLIFAKTVDDWLESRNLRKSQRKGIRSREAGIIAFAYHEPSFR